MTWSDGFRSAALDGGQPESWQPVSGLVVAQGGILAYGGLGSVSKKVCKYKAE